MSPDPLARRVAQSIGAGPHRMTVGLRALDLADWIEDGPDFDAQLHEKRALLDGGAETVGALDDTHAAQFEVLSLLADHLPRRFPDRYRAERSADGLRLTVEATGEPVAVDAAHPRPVALAGRLVPEDLCLMREGAHGYRLVAAALCFPTRWRLRDKLGQPMTAIHAPVPGYAATIASATDRVMAALTPERPVWRFNWSLLDSPVLHQPQRVPAAAGPPGAGFGDRLWLRSERQTLRRLPTSGDVLFTIRIRQCTLSDLCRVEGTAARLLAQIRSMPEALKAYKRILDIEGPLEDWLAAKAGPGTVPAPD